MAPIHHDDLAQLSDLDEHVIERELRKRFENNVIYTYIGDILVAINPFKDLPIYGKELGQRYGDANELSQHPPHIYAIGTMAYKNLRQSGRSQCLLVSGESGAGKTESSKMLLAQVVRLSPTPNTNIQDHIVEINPLLEAFGNAQTVMNNNSSRFGKLIEVMVDKYGIICGAKVTEHMLEKSRVVHKSGGERSFHIFYYLFAGLTDEEYRRFYLSRPEDYRIVETGPDSLVFNNSMEMQMYAGIFNSLKDIMIDIGFTPQEVHLIYGLVAGILHLCNIDFVTDPEMEQVIIVNEEEIDYTAALLCLQTEDLATVLLSNRAFVRGERIVTMKSNAQACDGRDALAKSIYSRLFSWIIQQINVMLKPFNDETPGLEIISILDMAGFENFPQNSLEQLCINSANEQLQSYFNEYIFASELREYKREGIKTPSIHFTNNNGILDLLMRRPDGIFAVLEDECRIQTGNHFTFVDRLNNEFSRNPHFIKSKSRHPVFAVNHYAGMVNYDAFGFVEKNRETLGSNFISLMENSKNKLIAQLFSLDIEENGRLQKSLKRRQDNMWNSPDYGIPGRPDLQPGETLSRHVGKKIKQRMLSDKTTVKKVSAMSTTAHFRNSLGELMKKLNCSEPHFVRCIRPNSYQRPDHFDNKIVHHQLKCCGVLETTKIRKLGYPKRIEFDVFMNRYILLGSLGFPLTPIGCQSFLKYIGLKDFEIGHSKVFLRYWHNEMLDNMMERKMVAVVAIQSAIRTFHARCDYFFRRRKVREDSEQIFILGQSIMEENLRLLSTQMRCKQIDLENFEIQLERRREEERQKRLKAQRDEEERQKKLKAQREEEERQRRLKAQREEEERQRQLKLKMEAAEQERQKQLIDQKEMEKKSQYNVSPWLKRPIPSAPLEEPLADYTNNGLSLEQRSSSERVIDQRSPRIPGSDPRSPTVFQREQQLSLPNPPLVSKPAAYGQSPALSPFQRNPSHDQTMFFYKRYVNQVLSRMSELDKDVWCKIHYMEYDQALAKCYVFDREITIDNSTFEFNGKRMGLASYNKKQDKEINYILQNVGQGLILQGGSDGTILATRKSSCEIFVKDYDKPMSADVLKEKGCLPPQETIKVFDMEEFKSCMALNVNKTEYLELRSVIGLSLGVESQCPWDTPAWLLIISTVALRNISDEAVCSQVQQRLAEIKLKETPKSRLSGNLAEAKARHHQRHWSKLNIRSSGTENEEPKKANLAAGKKKGDNTRDGKYAWEKEMEQELMSRRKTANSHHDDEAESVIAWRNRQQRLVKRK